MRTSWTQSTFMRVIQNARSPELVRLGKYALDVAGRCQAPACVEVTARAHVDRPIAKEWRTAAFLDMEVPCRRCEACRRQRASLWRERATRELAWTQSQGRRAWFVTLTLRPSAHLKMRYRAIKKFNDRGRAASASSHEQLSETDRRQTVERETAFEVVKYLKRVRKIGCCRFRYLLVTEAHASGEVHYHLLLTEVQGELRERLLRKQWPHGFARANLVRASDVVAAYATKVARYVSKDPSARVRASKGYGEPAAENSAMPLSEDRSGSTLSCLALRVFSPSESPEED